MTKELTDQIHRKYCKFQPEKAYSQIALLSYLTRIQKCQILPNLLLVIWQICSNYFIVEYKLTVINTLDLEQKVEQCKRFHKLCRYEVNLIIDISKTIDNNKKRDIV